MEITNRKLAIGEPNSYGQVFDDYHAAFSRMDKGNYQYFRAGSAPSVEDLRNGLVELALKTDCTHLLQLDTDMTPHPKTIPVMMDRDVDIIAALCFKRYPPFSPVMMRGENIVTEWEESELLEVDRAGTGVMMVKTDVFRKMEQPWFNAIRRGNFIAVGEDYNFCDKARELGYKIYVDTTIPAGHISNMIVDEKLFRLWEIATTIKEEHNG